MTRLLGILVAAPVLLAGCADGASDGFASYEDAKAAPGPTYEPTSGFFSSMRLKLLDPANPDSASGGRQPILVLLYDSQNDSPVRDAVVRLQSRMPAHNHEGTDEVDPVHKDHGVYEGMRNHFVPGEWVVRVDVQAGRGDARFEFEVTV